MIIDHKLIELWKAKRWDWAHKKQKNIEVVKIVHVHDEEVHGVIDEHDDEGGEDGEVHSPLTFFRGLEQRSTRRPECKPKDSWNENASNASCWALCI